MNRSPVRAVLGALLVVGVAATALSTPAGAAGTNARGVAPQGPEVGDCHALTFAEALKLSDPDAPVRCDQSHTSRTIAVAQVSPAVLDDEVSAGRASLRKCTPAFNRALGGTATSRKLSAYTYFWFVPTPAERQAGLSYIRCDLALSGGTALLALPTDREPALGALPHPKKIARCGDATRRGLVMKSCSRTHDHRASGTVRPKFSSWPGDKKMRAVAQRRCSSVTGTRSWYASWPTRDGWVYGGERLIVCYKPTRR